MGGLTWMCTTNYYAGAPILRLPARCREGVSVCGRRADLSWAAAPANAAPSRCRLRPRRASIWLAAAGKQPWLRNDGRVAAAVRCGRGGEPVRQLAARLTA